MNQSLVYLCCSNRVPEADIIDEIALQTGSKTKMLTSLVLQARLLPIPRCCLGHQKEKSSHPIVDKIRGQRQTSYCKHFCEGT